MIIQDAPANKIAIDTEGDVRLHLAAVYRLLAHFGMDDLIFTHASARVPGEDAFLINPFGLLFNEVSPASLVKLDFDGNVVGSARHAANAAGFVIHGAILRARPDVNCVIHTHTRAGVAVSCLADGILPMNQFAIEFHERIGYHDYEGIAFNMDEGARLDRDIEGKIALVLRNHGLLTVGATIPAAFYFAYYLEQTARVQMDVMATGRTVTMPDDATIAATMRQYTSARDPAAAGHRMWPALLRLLDANYPNWRTLTMVAAASAGAPFWSEPDEPLSAQHFAGVRLPLLEASTLPPWAYTSNGFYGGEVRHIFGRSWNFIGRSDQLREPGSYITLDFAGVPLAVVRDQDGKLRAFANTCRHRGARLLCGEGTTRDIRCPYHSWNYSLAGALRIAPEMDQTRGFDRAEFGLREFRLETWCGFLFVCFDPAAPTLSEFLGDLPALLEPYRLDDMVTTRRKEWDIACNWKIYVENAMESYHVPTVHAQTIQRQRRSITPPLIGNGQWCGLYTAHTGSRALEAGDTGFPHIPTLTGASAAGTYYILIYPSTMLALTFDCMWWLEIHPRGPQSMHLVSGACFPKTTVARDDFADLVQRYYRRWDKSIPEDNVISEVQQHGISSPFAQAGRLSHMEPLVHTFANWVLDRVVRGDDGIG